MTRELLNLVRKCLCATEIPEIWGKTVRLWCIDGTTVHYYAFQWVFHLETAGAWAKRYSQETGTSWSQKSWLFVVVCPEYLYPLK